MIGWLDYTNFIIDEKEVIFIKFMLLIHEI